MSYAVVIPIVRLRVSDSFTFLSFFRMEHPDPFVRKVAMYWMSRIVKAHMTLEDASNDENKGELAQSNSVTMASISVRNSVPHLLPGILLWYVGLSFHVRTIFIFLILVSCQ